MTNKFRRTILRLIPVALMCSSGILLTSCFDDEESTAEKYKEWRAQNEQYLIDAQSMTAEDGGPYYEKITPSWAPNAYVLIHWHNDRSLTEKNLSPLDNSTVSITYQLLNIEGDELSNSFNRADSLYTSRPSSNIIGMWAAMTNMHIGDSVTMVIPSQAAYGEVPNGNIPPYSTLIYNVKMKAISAYEVP